MSKGYMPKRKTKKKPQDTEASDRIGSASTRFYTDEKNNINARRRKIEKEAGLS